METIEISSWRNLAGRYRWWQCGLVSGVHTDLFIISWSNSSRSHLTKKDKFVKSITEAKCSGGEENKRSTWEKCQYGIMTLWLWNMIINYMLLFWIPQRLDLYRMFFFFPVLSYAKIAHFFKWPSNAMTWLENVYQRKSLLTSHLPHTRQSSPPDTLTLFSVSLIFIHFISCFSSQ